MLKMLFKQRLFSWLDSYDIYDEAGNTLYTVKGQLSWGHCLKIFDSLDREVGTVRERVITLLPRFEVWRGDIYVGCISRRWSLFRPEYDVDFNGWHVDGSWTEWDYTILGPDQVLVATVSKELFHWTDTYVITVQRDEDALGALMFVLAVDAEKCSRR